MQTFERVACFKSLLVANLQAADGKRPLTPPGKKAAPVAAAKDGKAKAANLKEAAPAEPEVPPPEIQVCCCSNAASLVSDQSLVCRYWTHSISKRPTGNPGPLTAF